MLIRTLLIAIKPPAVFTSTLILSLALGWCRPGQAEDTVKWSGFLNGGVCDYAGPLPTQWNQNGEHIVWQVELTGYGQSSPVVVGEQIVLTSTSGKNKDQFHVSALSLSSGEKLWQVDFDNPTPEENTSYVSRAAATAAVDAKGIYVVNEGGVLAAIDPAGQILWQRNLAEEYGPIKARHGIASSLEQSADRLFVWIERETEPYLMAVDKTSGQTAWRVAGLGATTWSSPRLLAVGEAQHLVCSAIGHITGFDPNSGEQLWTLTDIANNSTCTPVPAGNGRFLIGASEGRGEESTGSNVASNGLVQIVKQESGKYAAEFVWRAEKATSSFGSPLVADGRVWLVNRSGVLYQLDLETGKQLSASRIKAGSIWATPIVNSDNIYLFGQKGTTSVISLSDGQELAANSLWEASSAPASAGPPAASNVQYAAAAVDGMLLIRRGDRLYAIK